MVEIDNAIKIKDLNVIYNKGKENQVRALDGVNLEFQVNEWVILFGPSGCGKSTLLNSIAGLETPTSGKVQVLGKDIHSLSSDSKAEYRRKSVGMIFQSFHLINSLSVVDNVCLPQVFYGISLKKRRELALSFLDRFGIKSQAEKYPMDISGGQRQRVSIARALMNKPEIILADEPVGNLDSKATYNVLMILKELNSIDRKTVVMVTHDEGHLKYADRIVHIKDGKIIKVEIRKRKKNPKEKNEKRKILISKNIEIPLDLKLLMNSFKDLTNANMKQLLIPFKVKQTFTHLMLPITNNQVELTEKFMKKFFLGVIDKKELFDKLNDSLDDGGAGWDKRNAKNFVDNLVGFYEQSQQIEYSETFKSAIRLSKFFLEKYSLKSVEYDQNIFKSTIEERLKNEISRKEVQDILDKSLDKKGMGLDKRTAKSISRDLELIILIRFSG